MGLPLGVPCRGFYVGLLESSLEISNPKLEHNMGHFGVLRGFCLPGLVGVPGSLIAVHGFGPSLGSPIEVPDWDPNLVFLGVLIWGPCLGT